MDCPHCHSSSTTEQEGRTVHGFRRFRCRECGRRYNEWIGTALNRVQVPTDIMCLMAGCQDAILSAHDAARPQQSSYPGALTRSASHNQLELPVGAFHKSTQPPS